MSIYNHYVVVVTNSEGAIQVLGTKSKGLIRSRDSAARMVNQLTEAHPHLSFIACTVDKSPKGWEDHDLLEH